MSKLTSFFLTGPTAPAKLQVLLIAAAAVAIACLSLLVYGLWWRGEAMSARVELTAARAQVGVLSEGLASCNAGADHAKRVGDRAVELMGKLVDQAQRDGKKSRDVADSIDAIARQVRKAGENCDWAWGKIEAEERISKAGAAR